MLWAMPSRDVGRPARKIEEPDYCMISVWEKCITTVTAIPVLFGDGMSNLTGSVAPIDHAAYGHIKSHQKVDNVHIKVNYDPVTNPLLVCGRGLPRRPRASVVDAVCCAVAVQQPMPGRDTGVAVAGAAKGDGSGRKHCLCDLREYAAL